MKNKLNVLLVSMLIIVMMSIPVLSYAASEGCSHTMRYYGTEKSDYHKVSNEKHSYTATQIYECTRCGYTEEASSTTEFEAHSLQIVTESCRGTTHWLVCVCYICNGRVSIETSCPGH